MLNITIILTRFLPENVVVTVVLFCNMSLHMDGSSNAQPPRSQFHLSFRFDLLFSNFTNAIKIYALFIIINIIVIIVLFTLLIAI